MITAHASHCRAYAKSLYRISQAFRLAYSCRDDSTRTSDPYVPNVVRYQLRYIPLFWIVFWIFFRLRSVT